jgi:hypothetical protein
MHLFDAQYFGRAFGFGFATILQCFTFGKICRCFTVPSVGAHHQNNSMTLSGSASD